MTEHPPSAETLIASGNSYAETGDLARAKACFIEACQIDSGSGLAFFGLGTIFYRQEDNAQAIVALSKAAGLSPNIPEIWNNLGAAFGRDGQTAKSIEAFRRVCHLNPDHGPAAMNLGRLLLVEGHLEEGARWLRKAAEIRPGHAETLRILANAQLALGQPQAAEASAVQAIKANPDNIDTHLALGQAYLAQRQLDLAREKFRFALSRRPEHALAMYYLGETEEKTGRIEVARDLYDQILDETLDESFVGLLRLKRALALPVINESNAAIDVDRERIKKALAELPRHPVDDPYETGGFTNFYLAYQGREDLEIQEQIAQFYLDACPGLATVAPHVSSPQKRNDRYRIAIVSSFLRNHTVGYLCRGLIEHLDRSRFHVTLLRSPIIPEKDRVADEIAATADVVVDLPDTLATARELVGKVGADLVYFPEIGMEDLVYFLAFARSAPVQVMGWGHPLTSGIPNMDAFLSVGDMEPDNASAHYRERLIALNGLSLCVPEPVNKSEQFNLAESGLDPNHPIYLCAQSVFKIHPDFDAVIAALLHRDPEARLYFISSWPYADELFLSRLEKTVGSQMDRVKIIPRVHTRKFVALLGSADVLLDVPHWSGGKTSLDGLYANTPIVHWPGEFMRGRHTLAFYRKMGVTDCVVDSAETYVETAFRLVHDVPFREAVRTKIANSVGRLFNDTSAIDEIADVFESLILESR